MRARTPSADLAIEPAFVALRDLFTGPLSQVSFPDVDASAVGASVDELHRRAAALDTARAALASAERDLAAAEQALREQRAASIEQGHLALAYARVYAKSDPALVASIDRISLPKVRAASAAAGNSETNAPPRRRGRPTKTTAASDERVAAE